MNANKAEDEPRDELWALLGGAKRPKAPEGLEQRILRAVRESREAENAAGGLSWLERLQEALTPRLALPAGALALFLAIGGLILWTSSDQPEPVVAKAAPEVTQHDASAAAAGREGSASAPEPLEYFATADDQQFELILALDNYLEGEQQDLWTEDTETLWH